MRGRLCEQVGGQGETAAHCSPGAWTPAGTCLPQRNLHAGGDRLAGVETRSTPRVTSDVTGVPAPSWVPLLLGFLMALNLACLAEPLWRRGLEPGRGARPRAGAAALPVPTRDPAVDRGLGVADRGSFLGGGRPTCQGSLPLLTAAPRETDLHDPVWWARGGPNRWRPIPGRQGTRPGSLSQCNQTPPRQRATLCHGLYLQHLAAGLGTALYV